MMSDIREIKTPCQTIITVNDEEVLKDKRKFRSEVAAQRECNEINMRMAATEMLNVYQCSECSEWHLGRNGKKLTRDSKRALIKENVKLNVVGFVDLSKFEKKKKGKQPTQPKTKGTFSPRTEIKLKVLGKIDLPK